jgi:hypothetical protein
MVSRDRESNNCAVLNFEVREKRRSKKQNGKLYEGIPLGKMES